MLELVADAPAASREREPARERDTGAPAELPRGSQQGHGITKNSIWRRQLLSTQSAIRRFVLLSLDEYEGATLDAVGGRDAVRTACDVAGTASLYVQSPLERAVRDIQAVTQHIILREIWLEEAGRVILGMEPVVPMFAS